MYENILILDTNILLDLIEPDNYSNEVFDKLLHAIIINEAQVVIPKQVYIEWTRHNRRLEKEHEEKIENDFKKYFEILTYLEDKVEKDNIKSTLHKLNKYNKRMYRYIYGKRNEKLNDLLFTLKKGLIIEKSYLTDNLVVDFALEKKAPFFSNEVNREKTKVKTEAADAVIFFTAYENILENIIEAQNIYFITNNHKDYSAPNNPSNIHSNLEVYAKKVNLKFSNNLKEVLQEILGYTPIPEYSSPKEELKLFVKDTYFEPCPSCEDEVHINADSFIGNEPKAYEKTYWLRCRCGHEWSTGDLISQS